MMMPTSNRMVAVLISKNEITTSGVGRIRVRPVSTTKVRKVDSRARPTANGARNLLRGPPLRLPVPDSLYGLIGGWAAKAPASFPDFDLFGSRKPVSPIKCQEGVSGI